MRSSINYQLIVTSNDIFYGMHYIFLAEFSS